MNIWVVISRWDYENSATTHLTEKGAMLSALTDVLRYLEVTDDEGYVALLENNYDQHERSDLGVWDPLELKELKVSKLWKVWNYWQEFTWETTVSWEIMKTQVQP